MNKWIWAFVAFLIGFSQFGFCSSDRIQRVMIGLYDSQIDKELYLSKLHQFIEMPLNHLGFTIEYHDINHPLPDLSNRDDVLGVITWFGEEESIQNPKAVLDWALEAQKLKKKWVSVGNPWLSLNRDDELVEGVDHFWGYLGLRDSYLTATDQNVNRFISKTYLTRLGHVNPWLTPFEKEYKLFNKPFSGMIINEEKATPQVEVYQEDDPEVKYVLAATSKNGGYLADPYAVYTRWSGDRNYYKWYVNPFRFFADCLIDEKTPIPDTTTLAGRRIYYSHIDGDGWNEIPKILEHIQKSQICAEVLEEEIIKKYPDLPVTVAPIAADLDLTWYGLKVSQQAAKRIFLLPNVEVGCHTFTHPFFWGFFKNYDESLEEEFYEDCLSFWKLDDVELFEENKDNSKEKEEIHVCELVSSQGYSHPRAYAKKPFSVESEVIGAIDVINQFAPKNKKAKLYCWSGDCLPFEAVILKTNEAKIFNINGGITRFDALFDSFAWVWPLTRQVGSTHQIYASSINENIYTDGWTRDFHGFRNMIDSLENTDRPIRVKPINVYYHIYICQRAESLDSLTDVLDHCRTKDLCPIHASRFSSMVENFLRVQIERIKDQEWRIVDRGDLNTMRFDDAVFESVDFQKSKGVIGQRHFQGSLYVYLDRSVSDPVIAIENTQIGSKEPVQSIPYLIESRWEVFDVQITEEAVTFQTEGFGAGNMSWSFPDSWNRAEVIITARDGKSAKKNIEVIGNQLAWTFPEMSSNEAKVRITKAP